MAEVRIGISGWTYPHWRKDAFYPTGLAQKKELGYASHHLNSIEVNGTFYRLQKPKSYQSWCDQTPDDFGFTIKAGRYMTHIRRLKDMGSSLSNFMASGPLIMGPKLKAILWQFPPHMKLKDDRVESFLKTLTFDAFSAAELARNHSEKLADIAFYEPKENFPIRHAFEFRHESFANNDFIHMLHEYNVAFVVGHCGKYPPYVEDLTADFVYMRMHGQKKGQIKGYTKKEIKEIAQRVEDLRSGKTPKDLQTHSSIKPKKKKRDVFVYFDNDAKAYSPKNAMELSELLDINRPIEYPNAG